MSKTISNDLLAEFASTTPIIATCWKIQRRDGVILGFTDWPESFLFQATTYSSVGGYQRTALDQREGLNVDNMDIIGLIESDFITEEGLLAGLYKGAKVWIFAVSPPNLAWNELKLDYGEIGEVQIGEVHFVAEFRSLITKASNNFGPKYSRYCRHQLGESKIVSGVEIKCGIELLPDEWVEFTDYAIGDAVSPSTYNGRRFVCVVAGTSGGTEPSWDTTIGNTTADGTPLSWKAYDAYTLQGTVTGVTSDFIFTASGLVRADSWFQYGVLTWLTGANAGMEHDIKSSTAAGVFTVRYPTAYTIESGDTFSVSVGCNHILKMPGDTKGSPYTGDCRVKFNLENSGNQIQFGGEPEMPNLDRVAAPAGNI